MVDPELELRGGGGGGGPDLLALAAIFPSVISSFFSPGPLGPSRRSATGEHPEQEGGIVSLIPQNFHFFHLFLLMNSIAPPSLSSAKLFLIVDTSIFSPFN